MSNSRIEELIDEIEAYINSCKYVVLSNTNISVNKEEIDELLRELRSKTPDEIKRYQKIISNKEAILNDARQKAQELIDKTTAQTSRLVSEHQIMRDAYEQANALVAEAAQKAQDILNKATEEANQMKAAAVSYTDQLLADVERAVNGAIDVTSQHNEAILTELTGYSETIRQNRADLSAPVAVPGASSALQGVSAGPQAVAQGTDELKLDMVQ